MHIPEKLLDLWIHKVRAAIVYVEIEILGIISNLILYNLVFC